MSKKILDRLISVEKQLIAIRTDNIWIKRIIIGAASLGFVEKVIGHVWK